MFCQYHVTPCTENKSQVETLFCGWSRCIKTSWIFKKKCMQCWWLEADFKNRMCFLLLFLLCDQRLVVDGEDSDHVLLITEHVANRKEMFLVDSGNDKWVNPQVTKESSSSSLILCPPCLLDLLTWLFFFLVFLFILSQIHCTKGKQDAKLQSKNARLKE